MKNPDCSTVEAEIVKMIDEINRNIMNKNITVDGKCVPSEIGISSQILITIMSRVSNNLEMNLPNDCYIFFDKKTNRQLNIQEAAQKLVEKTSHGK